MACSCRDSSIWQECAGAENAKQMRASLDLDNDISDGIVFTLNAKHIMPEMSTYNFLHDALPLISYSIAKAQENNPY